MTTQNTFQEQLDDFFGKPTPTTLPDGVTGCALRSTTSDAFVVNWQGPEAPFSPNSGTSCGIEMKAIPASNASLIDFHSTSGYFTNSYDFRMQSTGGATGTDGQATMICIGKEFDCRCYLRTTPPSSPFGKPFFVDFGVVSVTPTVNSLTTITFNVTFMTPPVVQITWVDLGSGIQDHQLTEFIESTSTTECQVRCLGTPGAGFAYNWTAIGGVVLL